ncbi:unnamed protein product [Brachionus calyciflorus]|uniref:Uncharacterized protein n=1 Tax=Brachionus calyciflorus TaxID=104777 RepID=A0A814C831_9BILA|nr:unnamed protein product [Brachionus calyciflorus]
MNSNETIKFRPKQTRKKKTDSSSEKVDNFKLVANLQARNQDLILPKSTQNRLIRQLEMSEQQLNTTNYRGRVFELSPYESNSNFEHQVDRGEIQSGVISSVGRVAASLMWDIKLKLGNFD